MALQGEELGRSSMKRPVIVYFCRAHSFPISPKGTMSSMFFSIFGGFWIKKPERVLAFYSFPLGFSFLALPWLSFPIFLLLLLLYLGGRRKPLLPYFVVYLRGLQPATCHAESIL